MTQTSVPSQQPAIDPQRLHDAREPEAAVLDAIRGTTYGTIEITVHQSRIVQITRSEKVRFEPR
jgi:hypothetical protein